MKKTEDKKQKEAEKNLGFGDVASILARRIAVEYSDSSESESEYDDSEWDDDDEK